MLETLYTITDLFHKYKNTYAMRALGVFCIYFLGAKLGLFIFFAFNTSPALIWPPVGLGLAAVLLGGYQMALPIFLAQFLVSVLQINMQYGISFIIALAYALQAVVGTYVLRVFKFEPALYRARNIMLLVGVAFTITAIEPTIATFTQVYLGTLTITPFLNWARAWGAGIFSVIIITPFILTWYPFKNFTYTRKELIEIIPAFTLLFINNYVVFWTPYAQYFGIAIIFFLPAVLIWFGLRLSMRWFTLAILLTSFEAILGTILTNNPDVTPLSVHLLADEIYIGLIAAIFLVFVAIVEERRIAHEKLEEAYRSIAQADKAKTEFIAILAHELRNPLAALVTSLELLELKPTKEEAALTIKNSKEQTSMMGRLLDDLLDTVRLTQNKFNLQKESISIRKLIDQSISSIEEQVYRKNLELRVAAPQSDIILTVDPVRVKQILVNLLSNAVKYTPEGGKIELICEPVNSFLRIRVADTGVGIDEDKISRLFDPFRQFDESSSYRSGLGIGLYITKRIVEMHEGHIKAQSDGEGRGSVFTVFLPLDEQVPVIESPRAPATNEAKRILIVDDNEPVALGMKKLLESRGHVAQTVFTGYSALETIEKYEPTVVLLDIGLPDISGYDVAKKLRAGGWKGDLVAFTGFGQEGDRKRAREAGFNHHLIKPVGIEDVIGVLAKL